MANLHGLWKCLTSLILFNFSLVIATDYQPWFGNFYEFELRSDFNFQGYAWVASGENLKKYSSNDLFLNLSLSNSIPDPSVGLELEITDAKTRKQYGEIDQLKLTSRYLFQDDIAGDPLGIMVGLSYIQAFKNSLRDVSSFHHGLYNTELFISLGKENPDECLWGTRWWGVFAVGVAEQGSPWLRIRLDYDKRWFEKHEFGLFADGLCGLGGKKLQLKGFSGYGPIKHQSIDVGFHYTYLLEYYGNVSLEYSYRIYAENFPSYAHRVIAQVFYTFGL